MRLDFKKVRYAYWVALAFLKKNLQPLILSFLISLLGIITIVSFSPYIVALLTTQREIIGIAGNYTINELPDEIVSKYSNGILYVNNEGELIPLLADSWEPIDGGKEYRFHIKKDLLWNDGTPFTARDIKYQFKDVEVVAESDYLLKFKLKKPLAIFPIFLTKPIIKPPVTGVAGLYTVSRLKTDQGYVKLLQLNPNQKDLPVLIYKFYETDSKMINAYKLGEITKMNTTKSSVANIFENWKNTKIEKNVDYSKVMTLFFNFNNPLLKEEKDLRHSVAESIDRSQFEKFGQLATGPIPPVSWAYSPEVKNFKYNPNVASKIAKKYIDSSQSADLVISTYYDNLTVSDEIKDDLKNIGFNTRVEVLAGALPQDYSIFIAQLSLGNDPDQYFFWHSTQTTGNITGYNNVRVDKLLEDGRNTFSIDKRKEFYADFQRILVDDMPAYFLYYPYNYTIIRK